MLCGDEASQVYFYIFKISAIVGCRSITSVLNSPSKNKNNKSLKIKKKKWKRNLGNLGNTADRVLVMVFTENELLDQCFQGILLWGDVSQETNMDTFVYPSIVSLDSSSLPLSYKY